MFNIYKLFIILFIFFIFIKKSVNESVSVGKITYSYDKAIIGGLFFSNAPHFKPNSTQSYNCITTTYLTSINIFYSQCHLATFPGSVVVYGRDGDNITLDWAPPAIVNSSSMYLSESLELKGSCLYKHPNLKYSLELFGVNHTLTASQTNSTQLTFNIFNESKIYSQIANANGTFNGKFYYQYEYFQSTSSFKGDVATFTFSILPPTISNVNFTSSNQMEIFGHGFGLNDTTINQKAKITVIFDNSTMVFKESSSNNIKINLIDNQPLKYLNTYNISVKPSFLNAPATYNFKVSEIDIVSIQQLNINEILVNFNIDHNDNIILVLNDQPINFQSLNNNTTIKFTVNTKNSKSSIVLKQLDNSIIHTESFTMKPKVDTITSNLPALGGTISISGQFLDQTNLPDSITIGNFTCSNLAIENEELLTCQIGAGYGGNIEYEFLNVLYNFTFDPFLQSASILNSSNQPILTITNDTNIITMEPIQANSNFGLLLKGYGFYLPLTISVNNVECNNISLNYSHIQCHFDTIDGFTISKNITLNITSESRPIIYKSYKINQPTTPSPTLTPTTPAPSPTPSPTKNNTGEHSHETANSNILNPSPSYILYIFIILFIQYILI